MTLGLEQSRWLGFSRASHNSNQFSNIQEKSHHYNDKETFLVSLIAQLYVEGQNEIIFNQAKNKFVVEVSLLQVKNLKGTSPS